MNELEKAYDASKVEADIYTKWLESGYFNPDNLPNAQTREPFTIVLPPPNVTGTLHMGHAFEDTIQDALVRYNRMQGRRALWIPGTDHAAIATQSKFEKELTKKEGKSRHDFDRQTFFGLVHEYALSNQSQILNQLKKMGLSLDWSRLAFTLDETREKAVRTAFKKMYDTGLIGRGYRIVNWDPKGQTTVSDDEVTHEETKGVLYTFRYSKNFPIPISSTRPETKVGDTAVAVHPEDSRYQGYIGQVFEVEFAGTKLSLKIVSDENVDPEFGTGALGVTPAHSQIDWEIAEKNNLPKPQVINEYAKMTDLAGPLISGKKTLEARESIVTWLKEQELLEKEEQVTQNITKAERTGGIIEPLPKLQWFVFVNKEFTHEPTGKTTTLKNLMREAVTKHRAKIIPERFEKTYFHWIENLRDWCISRQIIYGHQIPVWYKDTKTYCGTEAPKENGWVQDTDTLDTWFSSGLWTFSTLGWPEETQDLKTYHPTSIVVPGYEILFFWVARMILMSTFLLGTVPFKAVYLHGIVRDSKGQKFSKSLNNGIDPLDMTAKYGTDALRMAMVFGAAPGNDVKFDEQNVKGMKHFANKLWNIARFVMTNLEVDSISSASPLITDHYTLPTPQTEADKIILQKLEATVQSVTSNLDAYNLHEAAQQIYQFTWHEFADIYIEASKTQLQDPEIKQNTLHTLHVTLVTILKLLHPFMPFITEHIWQLLKERNLVETNVLMVSQWPKA